MQRLGVNNFPIQNKSLGMLAPILVLWTIVATSVIVWLLLDEDISKTFPQYYLFPWVFVAAISIAIPNLYLIKKKQFNFFHPLTFAAWSYFIPAFIVGGIILSTGISEPWFMSLISDATYNLPLTMVYVSLGYLGLSIGFFLPFSEKIGRKIGEMLPIWEWQANQVTLPAFVLLLIGLANTVLAFFLGILGFQRSAEIGAYDGSLFLLTLLWLEAAFLLCLWIFRAKKFNSNHYFVIGFLALVTFSKAAFQGNRGSLLQVFVLVTMAYVFSGRKITAKHGAYGSLALVGVLLIGMIYGTTFRSIKQTEERISFDQYAEYVFTALGSVFEQDLSANFTIGISAFAERLESVSSLAVVVSTYEQQQPYEESYGLDNNIIKDSLIFFIPRPLWQDKPVASESHRYADLYFNFAENSFTITPMGDLLRNFGSVGVPLGMMLLGYILRILYTSLVEVRPDSMWRLMIYYLLLTTISYEAFYSTIIPILFKHGVVAILGVLFIQFFIWQSRRGLRG
jgi:hypothetical protein